MASRHGAWAGRRRSGLAVVVGAAAALAAPAGAQAAGAPIYVNLRVVAPDGKVVFPRDASELQEGRPSPFRFTGDRTGYPCDAGDVSVTPGSLLSSVATQSGPYDAFDLRGTFDSSTQTPTITRIGGQDVTPDPASGRHLAEWINGVPATRGACQDSLTSGDRVVFAYGRGDEQVLRVSYTFVVCGTSYTTVTDEATGAPVEGARVGDAVSDADGRVLDAADDGSAGSGGAPARKDGYIPSDPTIFAIAGVGCAGPIVPIVPSVPPAPPAPAPPVQPAPAVAKVTLAAASRPRLGALRFTASSTRAGTARVTARIGGVTLRRSLTFRRAGSVTFRLRTSSAQRRRLRRALRRGPVAVRATIRADGASATTAATLRR